MAQHLRTARVVGTAGALGLWLAGLVSIFGFVDPVVLLVGAGIGVVGAALLWGERVLARRRTRSSRG